MQSRLSVLGSTRTLLTRSTLLAMPPTHPSPLCPPARPQRALMPLHKPKCLPAYHQQLSYCVTQVRKGLSVRVHEARGAWVVVQGRSF